ncbi:MAG: hypothetical protein GYA15_07165 [Leptolinea sp.]|jgi:hypothetical protein|nr:hypothetical protein [Leptolinea sp.]
MNDKNTLIKILAITGSLMVWFDVLLPFVFCVGTFIGDRVFRFDYVLPAEIFPVPFIGGLLLWWAALRVRSNHRIIGWGLLGGVVALVGGQAIAVISGLASGAIPPEGGPWMIVMASLFLFILAFIVVGVGGIRLLRFLFGRRSS